jgi:hypothetical protein
MDALRFVTSLFAALTPPRTRAAARRALPAAALALTLVAAALVPARAAPLSVTLGLDAGGSVAPKTGTAVIGGTVACDEEATGFVEVVVRQRVGRTIIVGQAFAEVACDGEPTSWSATVNGGNGLFVAGRAQVSARTQVCAVSDPATCATDETGAEVRLRGKGKQ